MKQVIEKTTPLGVYMKSMVRILESDTTSDLDKCFARNELFICRQDIKVRKDQKDFGDDFPNSMDLDRYQDAAARSEKLIKDSIYKPAKVLPPEVPKFML